MAVNDFSLSLQCGTFPTASSVLLGVGLGGFFDGIVFHQVLQWHHMVSHWYPPTSVANLRLNTWWDGLFHSMAYVTVLIAVCALWQAAHRRRVRWSGRRMCGALLMGWGGFNLVEGLIDHQILELHHVNERVVQSLWIYWDLSFLAWGALMLILGGVLFRTASARGAPRFHARDAR